MFLIMGYTPKSLQFQFHHHHHLPKIHKMSQMQINLICINGMSLANNFQIYLYSTFFLVLKKRNTFFECFTLIQCTLNVIIRFKLSFNSKLVYSKETNTVQIKFCGKGVKPWKYFQPDGLKSRLIFGLIVWARYHDGSESNKRNGKELV